MKRARPGKPRLAPPAGSSFGPGDAIVVVSGLSKGLEGTVLERWHDHGDVAAYRVDLGGLLRSRVIRSDYLLLRNERKAPSC